MKMRYTDKISTYLTLLFLLGHFSVTAADFVDGEFCYNLISLTDKTCECAGFADVTNDDILIPSHAVFEGEEWNVIRVAPYAFNGHQTTNSVIISEGIEEIGNSAFARNYHMQTLTLPNSLKKIGIFSFTQCHFTEITLPSGITTIPQSAFSWNDCSTLHLEDLVTIGYHAFESCYYLTNLFLGENLHLIDREAFASSNHLRQIMCKSALPPTITGNTFPTIVNLKAVLYVPIGASKLYKEDTYWGKFLNIIETDEWEGYEEYGIFLEKSGSGEILVNNQENDLFLKPGSKVDFSIKPAFGYTVSWVGLNNIDITAELTDGTYTIDSLTRSTSVVVDFVQDSGIEDVSVDNEFEYYISNKTITFPKQYYIEIYDHNGCLIHNDLTSQYTFPQTGIYLIIKDKKIRKILI